MTHIDKKSKEEKACRKEFAYAEEGVVVADDAIREKVKELLALRHKIDEDELRASKMKAEIMRAMGRRTTLVDKDGVKLASWTTPNEKRTTDWDGLIKKIGIGADLIESFTTYNTGARVFSIEEI